MFQAFCFCFLLLIFTAAKCAAAELKLKVCSVSPQLAMRISLVTLFSPRCCYDAVLQSETGNHKGYFGQFSPLSRFC